MPTTSIAPAAPGARQRSETAVVVLLVVTAGIVLTQLYLSIPLRPAVAADLGPAGTTTALAAGYSFCYAIGFLVHGPLSDHLGRRRVLVWGLAALTAATVAVGFTTSVPTLGALRAVQGAAAATFAPTALAYLGEALPPRRRPLAIGAISVAFLTAGILGQLVATAVTAAAGWRWVFHLSGIALATITATAAVMVREPDVTRPPLRLASRYAHLIRFTVQPGSLVLCTGHLVVLGGFVAMYTLLGPHLTDAGLTPGEVMVIRAAALPAMLTSLLVGWLLNRLGAPGSALAGFAVAAVSLAAEALLPGNPAGIAVASLGFVAGVAVLVPTMITIWGDAAHPARGTGMAVNGFVLFLGAALGSFVTELPGDFTTPLLILAVAYLAAGFVVFAAANDTRRRLHDEPETEHREEKIHDTTENRGPAGDRAGRPRDRDRRLRGIRPG